MWWRYDLTAIHRGTWWRAHQWLLPVALLPASHILQVLTAVPIAALSEYPKIRGPLLHALQAVTRADPFYLPQLPPPMFMLVVERCTAAMRGMGSGAASASCFEALPTSGHAADVGATVCVCLSAHDIQVVRRLWWSPLPMSSAVWCCLRLLLGRCSVRHRCDCLSPWRLDSRWPGGMVDVPSDATKLVDRRQREERKQRLAAAGRGLAALEAAQPALWASLLSSQFDALFYEPQESQWALCRPLFPLIMGNREVRLLLRAGVCPQHTSL